jgi:hypothetical protein
MNFSKYFYAEYESSGAIPKLKKVSEPVVKNGAMPGGGPSRPPPKPMNSVEREKEILFQDQQRQIQQARERDESLRREEEERRKEEQKQLRMQKMNTPLPTPKPQNSRKVHFSAEEAARQQMAMNNYNTSASSFQIGQINHNENGGITMNLPVQRSSTGTKVAMPKFRATAPRAWCPGGDSGGLPVTVDSIDIERSQSAQPVQGKLKIKTLKMTFSHSGDYCGKQIKQMIFILLSNCVGYLTLSRP